MYTLAATHVNVHENPSVQYLPGSHLNCLGNDIRYELTDGSSTYLY